MDKRAIIKAESRLRTAKKAISDLESSKTFNDFSDNWYVFLTSAKNVYTVLEKGAETSAQSRQWFGAKANFRRSDPLLQYLYEARNDDEHGLGSSVDLTPERHLIGVFGTGYSNSFRIDTEPSWNITGSDFNVAAEYRGIRPAARMRITSLDGKPVRIVRTPATTILMKVSARGNRTYHPPDSHLGKPLTDKSPLGVAMVALAYLDGLVQEASSLA